MTVLIWGFSFQFEIQTDSNRGVLLLQFNTQYLILNAIKKNPPE